MFRTVEAEAEFTKLAYDKTSACAVSILSNKPHSTIDLSSDGPSPLRNLEVFSRRMYCNAAFELTMKAKEIMAA